MSGEEKDFASMYDTYYLKIVGYLRRIVGEAEAEDVAQETFVKAAKALDGFRGESSLATWLYRIATNAATDHLRKPDSRQTTLITDGVPDDDSPGSGETIPDNERPVLDTLLIRKDMNECIRGVVDGLPENYRSVLVLSELEGMTNAEISQILCISLDTVKIRLHRARIRLRKELESKCNFYHDDRNELACDRKTTSLKFIKR